MNSEINDKRVKKDFSKVSFSGYKKTSVKKQLIQSILNNRVEPSNYWAAEMICAGHFLDLWEIIIMISTKHIHFGNPKLPIFLDIRINEFKNILLDGYVDNELKLRNNKIIRTMFSEIISILVFSQKKHSYDVYKIQQSDFDLTEIKFRLKADSLKYAEKVFQKDDAKEIFIAANELAYSISNRNIHKNSSDACYWIDWILEFIKISKSKKQEIFCERRCTMPVSEKFQRDPIWIVWEILIIESDNISPIVKKIVHKLLSMFCLHYSSGVKKRRRYILYFIVSLLTETIDYTLPIQNNSEIITKIKDSINFIYKEIKKNEKVPDTEYLFNGIKRKSNLDKTLEKLDKLKTVGFLPQ
mgnify:CR=1 FL=1